MKRLLTILILLTVGVTAYGQFFGLNQNTQLPIEVTNNVLYCYEMDEGSFTSTLTDAAIGCNGSLSTSSFTQNLTGIMGRCVENIDDSGSFGNSCITNIQSEFSVSLWIKGDASPTTLSAIFYYFSTLETFFVIENLEGKQVFGYDYYDGSTYVRVSNVGEASNNVWNHIVVTRSVSNSEIKFYINGVRTHTESVSLTSIYIGGMRFGNEPSGWTGNTWQHYYDQNAAWDKVLNADEVEYLYNSGSGRTYTNW